VPGLRPAFGVVLLPVRLVAVGHCHLRWPALLQATGTPSAQGEQEAEELLSDHGLVRTQDESHWRFARPWAGREGCLRCLPSADLLHTVQSCICDDWVSDCAIEQSRVALIETCRTAEGDSHPLIACCSCRRDHDVEHRRNSSRRDSALVQEHIDPNRGSGCSDQIAADCVEEGRATGLGSLDSDSSIQRRRSVCDPEPEREICRAGGPGTGVDLQHSGHVELGCACRFQKGEADLW